MAAAMGELLVYAENFYRRFPEEFLALGAPGLEEIFDLRPHGTRSRRISETPAEKTVEITIRRWQAPSLMPHSSLLGAHAMQQAAMQQASYQASYPPFSSGSPFQAGYPPVGASPFSAFSHPAAGLAGCSGATACGAAAATAPWAAAATAPSMGPLAGAWPRSALIQDLAGQQAAMGQQAAAGTTFPSFAAPAPPAAAPAPAASLPQQPPAPEQQPQQANGTSAEATYVNTQLTRLESALELIKPQIEAALVGRAAPAPAQPAQQAPVPATAATAITRQSSSGFAPDSPESPLRERRKLGGLSIVKPEILRSQTEVVKPAPVLKDVPVKAPADAKPQASEGGATGTGSPQAGGANGISVQAAPAAQVELQLPTSVEVARKGSKDTNRPRAVNACRVAASILDPESPRSPGKYSAWK